MRATHQRLYINIDHVATLRQARRSEYPDPVEAALACEKAGADGITAHLREDRRHIQDDDVLRLARTISGAFNLEMAPTVEMLSIAQRLEPYQVTLVPERREEVTTEGGLDVESHREQIRQAIELLGSAGIRTSLFIDPVASAVQLSSELGADAIELHTGQYANAMKSDSRQPLAALRQASRAAAELGLAVHAGHGLTVANVGPVAAIAEIEELNIGHSIVSRAIMIGIGAAVREMRAAMDENRDVAR